MLNKIAEKFEFEKLGTSWSTEIIAGISLFLSLSYIFILNPAILSGTGIPVGAVFFATVIASGIATLCMGLFAKLPFALAPGLESNGFFAFVVVATLGFTWQEGLGLVFWSGVLCVLFTIFPVRQNIIDAIPEGLKTAIATTVGVFVAVIGLVISDVIIFTDGLPAGFGDLSSGKPIVLICGFIIALLLCTKFSKFPAGMLVAIVVSAFLASFLGIKADIAPAESKDFLAALGELDIFAVLSDPRAWSVLLVFFIIDFYGSIGKFIGLTRQTNLQTNGSVKNMKNALNVDGGGTILGSLLGTSTVITYVESAVAIGQGGRTGIVAVVCGLLMLLSLVFSPLVSIVPTVAVSGILLYVGWMLLPREEIRALIKSKNVVSLSRFDLVIILLMGAIAALTFSLDKSLLLGFVAYTLKEVIGEKRMPNMYLAGSALGLVIAMTLQYIELV